MKIVFVIGPHKRLSKAFKDILAKKHRLVGWIIKERIGVAVHNPYAISKIKL